MKRLINTRKPRRNLKKYQPPSGQKSLGDFFDGMKKEQFWCDWCDGYFGIELEVGTSAGMLMMMTCGHKDLKENARRMTRRHKEVVRNK